jgi:hypothetical protein
MKGRIGKDGSYVLKEFPIRTGTYRTRSSLQLLLLTSSPVEGYKLIPHVLKGVRFVDGEMEDKEIEAV